VTGLSVENSYPEDWGGDVPLFASRRWLEVMAGRIEGEPLWFSTRAARGVRVGLAGYLVTDPGAYPFGNVAALAASQASPFAPRGVRDVFAATPLPRPDLFPHLLLTWPGYASFPVGPGHDDARAVRDALARVVGWAADGRAAAVAIPYAPGGSVLAGEARQLGFASIPLTHDATLPVPAGGFVEFLERLTAHRRRRVAAERRAWRDRGLRAWRVERVTAGLLDRMALLRAAHRSRYAITCDPADERARIAALLDRLGGAVDLFAAGTDTAGDPADVLCFSLFVRDRATWHALYFGADGGDPRSRGGYFEAVFYTPIEHGEDLGMAEISFGLGASRAKLLRGCVLTPVECLLAPTTERAGPTIAGIAQAWRATDTDAREGLHDR
jgi:hypothetical protein